MGGSGSGNWCRADSKTLAEHCCTIDVLQLYRWRFLKPWLKYPLKWNNGSNIIIETIPGAIKLIYSIPRNGQPSEDVRIKVPLSWSSCNYGGKRPWFICPDCGRRVAKLYLDDKYFLCRHCHDLVYSSQRVPKEFRLLDEADKIYQRLGIKGHDDTYIKPKPKGMHQATYDMLIDKAMDIECRAMREMIKKMNHI